MNEAKTNPIRDGVPLAAVFSVMPAEFRDAVASEAVRSRDAAPAGLRKALNEAINSRIQVKGFRLASQAPPPRLDDPVRRGLDVGNSELGGALLRVWGEARPELRSLVQAYLETTDLTRAEPRPDDSARTLPIWLENDWRQHVQSVLAAHPDQNEHAAGLMLCLVIGRVPVREADEASLAVGSPRLRKWLDELSELSPTARDWGDLDAFLNAARQLADAKAKRKTECQLKAAELAIKDIHDNHQEDVKYLGLDIGFWPRHVEARPDLIDGLLGVVKELKSELTAYQPLRPQAPSSEEERRRAPERGRREAAITEIMNNWDELMASPKAPPEVQGDRPVFRVDATAPTADHETELEALRQALDAEKNAKILLQTEHDGYHQTIGELEKRHDASAEKEKYWREMYYKQCAHSATSSMTDMMDGTPAPANPLTVEEAIAKAKELFSQELVFALNNKSKSDTNFEKPEQLLDALCWLATDYRQSHLKNQGSSASSDLPLSIRKACDGWFFKRNQTSTTIGMYADWYKATANGKSYDLCAHIGKGNTRNLRSTIRVAFAWDEDNAQVIVGYIGPHQRNRQS